MAAPQPEPGRCAYFVARKKRFCRMVPALGKRFCGEHGHQEVPGRAGPGGCGVLRGGGRGAEAAAAARLGSPRHHGEPGAAASVRGGPAAWTGPSFEPWRPTAISSAVTLPFS